MLLRTASWTSHSQRTIPQADTHLAARQPSAQIPPRVKLLRPGGRSPCPRVSEGES